MGEIFDEKGGVQEPGVMYESISPSLIKSIDNDVSVLDGLTPRVRRFCELMAESSRTASEAATLVGFHPQYSYELLKNSAIHDAINYYKQHFADKAQISKEKLIRDYAIGANVDITSILDDAFNVLPLSQWPDEARKALNGIEVTIKNGQRLVKPKFDRMESRAMLAKILRLVEDKVDNQQQGLQVNIFASKEGEKVETRGLLIGENPPEKT